MVRKKSHRHSAPGRPGDGTTVQIYGLHAVRAVLENPARQVMQIWATDNAAEKLQQGGLPVPGALHLTTAQRLNDMLPEGTVHQGVVVQTRPLARLGADHPMLHAPQPENGPLVVLDQVTDPRNVGAILRAAAVFGACGLVMTRRHRPPETGVLAKAASGGLEHVPIIEVGNLARTLADLGTRGFQVLGLDSDGDVPLEEMTIIAQPVLVMGSEGAGLRRLTRERCERICRLSATGKIVSLNVSAAAAVALHTVVLGLNRPQN